MRISKFVLLISLIGCFMFADPPAWDTNDDGLFDDITSYQNNGSITSAIIIDDINSGSPGDMLGAFIGEELRGLGLPTSVPFGPYAGTYQFLTLIYSNEASGEQVSFKYYDFETDELYDIDQEISFISDMTLGNVTAPEILSGNSSDESGAITDGCELPDNTIYLTDSGDVLYNIPTDIAGIQFTVDGTTTSAASGGEAAAAGFVLQAAGSTVLGFSFTGASISTDCGTLLSLTLAGDATGLSGLVFSDSGGVGLDIIYYEEDSNDCASNFYDCDGVCDGPAVEDCAGICDGTAVEDCAGVCGGDAVLSGCDNVCGSTAVEDCAGVCGGDAVLSGCDNACQSTAVEDCAGVCDGDAVLSGCDNACQSTAVEDCAGVCDGNAILDECDECVSGSTGLEPCPIDCNGDYGGFAVIDLCGDCVLGNTNLPFVDDTDTDGICDTFDICSGYDDNIDSDEDNLADGCDECPLDSNNDIDNDGVCANDEINGCMDSEAINYNDLATENSGCIYDFETPPSEFSNNVSSSLAYYFIGSIAIDGTVLSPEDWVGAFNGDICVGSRRWNTQDCSNGICDIPVYGDDGSSLTEGYMNAGDVPSFKVYDYDANEGAGAFYDINGPDTNNDGLSDGLIQSWNNLATHFISQLSVVRDCADILGGNTFDSDQDGYCDCDSLIFGDNCDFDPNDPNCWIDTDGDGVCDPYDSCAGHDDMIDYDEDTVPDGCDNDDDNDGAFDSLDSDDNNPYVCSDNDTDTCDDCSSGTYNISLDGPDFDNDGACDDGDNDDDNDGSLDDEDLDPLNSNICSDSDADTCDDCSSGTFNIDNDGFDYDSDGICDNGDDDDDNDGSLDENDSDDQNQYACSDTESFYFFGNNYIGDGCDDCSSGSFNINNDGSDNDLDSLCDIGDFCDQDAANDIDDDGICFNEESLGCTNNDAINLDVFATDDDGSCLFSSTYTLDYHAGANLASYSLHPTSDEFSVVNFSDLFSSDNLNSILGDVSATTNISDIGWIGSLNQLDRVSGYWLKLDNSDMVEYEAHPHGQHIISMDQTNHQVLDSYYEPFEVSYSLNSGNNLISFPGENILSECYMGENGCEMLNYNLLDVLPQNMEGILSGILGEGTAAAYIDGSWAGSLVSDGFSGFKGYWFRVNEDVNFNFNLSEIGMARNNRSLNKEYLEGYQFIQSSSQSAYFIKNIVEANLGDWIIAFNDDIVVGARKWNGQIIDIPVMGFDGESYSVGYTQEGDAPTFMLYETNTNNLKQLHGIVPSFSNNEIFIIDELSTDSFVVPTEVTLNNAYPNPFNPITNISFSLPIKMHVELNILDIQGKIVKKVLSGTFNQGLNNVQIDGQSLSSGLYFIQLVAGAEVEYSKVLLLK